MKHNPNPMQWEEDIPSESGPRHKGRAQLIPSAPGSKLSSKTILECTKDFSVGDAIKKMTTRSNSDEFKEHKERNIMPPTLKISNVNPFLVPQKKSTKGLPKITNPRRKYCSSKFDESCNPFL